MPTVNIFSDGPTEALPIESQVSLITAYGDFDGGSMIIETEAAPSQWVPLQIIASDGTLVPVTMTSPGRFLTHVPSINCRFNFTTNGGGPDVTATVSAVTYHP